MHVRTYVYVNSSAYKCYFFTFIYTYNLKKISKNYKGYIIWFPNTTKKYYAFFSAKHSVFFYNSLSCSVALRLY